MNRRWSRTTTWIIGFFGIIAGIFVLFFLFVDTETVWTQVRALNWVFALAASAMLVLALLVHGARWRYLLANQVRLSSAFHAANICHAMNMWLPLRPGEPARIIILGEDEAVSMSMVTGTVLVDRWLDNVMRLLFMVVAVSIGMGLASSAWTIGGASLVMLGFLGLMLAVVRYRDLVLTTWPRYLARVPKWSEEGARRSLAGIVDGLAGVNSLRHLTILLAWSLLVWAFLIAYHYLILVALGVGLETRVMWTLALGAVVLAPPTAATQPGLYHASVVAPLTVVSFDSTLLTAYAVVLHLVQNVCITALAAWGVYASSESLGKVLGDVRRLFERPDRAGADEPEAADPSIELGVLPTSEEV